MARVAGISPASVQRIWVANEIKPHLTRTFKLSNDPNFEEKLRDVIGMYLNPPDKALVALSWSQSTLSFLTVCVTIRWCFASTAAYML